MAAEDVSREYSGVERPKLDLSRVITEYLTEMMSATEHLTFGNPHGFRFNHRLPLQDVWIPQEVTVVETGHALTIASPTELIQLSRREGMQIDAALNMTAFRQTVIVSRPGYGKTTLCRRLAYRSALEAKMKARGWIPVLLTARTLNHAGVWSSSDELLGRIDLIQHNPGLRDQLGEAGVRGQLWYFIDGLDEVVEGLLPELRSRLASGILASPNKVTITCRMADYVADQPVRELDGLPVLELSGFSEDTLDLYIENWHKHAGRGRPGWSLQRLSATRSLLDAHSELRDLAESPLLAAVLCVVESRSRQAAVGRATVLKQAVDYLLLRPEWRHGESPDPYAAPLEPDVLIEMAGKLAFRMLKDDIPAVAAEPGVPWSELHSFVAEQLGVADFSHPDEQEAATLAYLGRLVGKTAAGLLQESKAGWYEFTHRNFQEYLAAQHLAGYVSHGDRLDLALQPVWREVFIFAASIAQMTREGLADLLMLVRTLLKDAILPIGNSAEADRLAGGACLAAEMLAELGEDAVRRYGLEAAVSGEPSANPDDPTFGGLWTTAVNTVFNLAEDQRLSRKTRIRALCVVSRIRDPRFQDEHRNLRGNLGAVIAVPGGQGQVGTERPLPMYESKQVPSSPAAQVEVKPFDIGLRPVTNLEYGNFVAAGGYDEPAWWQGEEAGRWQAGDPDFIASLVDLWERQKDLNFVKEFGEPEFAVYAHDASIRIARRTMSRSLPLYWRDSRFNLPTAPVVGVNLWEAQAYCLWLQERWRREGRVGPDDLLAIPTETEWEWAAGRSWMGQPRAYPWGDNFDENRCLVRDFSDPTSPRIIHFGGIPVGFFSLGTSGPEEMGGNVWEWTTSLSLPWRDPRDRESPGGLDKRIVRGGSWFSRERMATHVSFRLDDPPCNAYWDLGFRIVVRRRPDRSIP